MFFGNASEQSDDLITRNIFFAQPVVTNRFKIIVYQAASSVVFKMDLIGMAPDQKYRADPVLDSNSYEDGNIQNIKLKFRIYWGGIKIMLDN